MKRWIPFTGDGAAGRIVRCFSWSDPEAANILLAISTTNRVSCTPPTGTKAFTPRLTRSRGMLFNNAFVASPAQPSRAALLTAAIPGSSNMRALMQFVSPKQRLSDLLERDGYFVVCALKRLGT